ncbi:MAG TPA: response regulator [Gammaproteobacteria bacterium]|nr:response regulator [Gammaproteobacteria bacterium]
MPNDIMRAPQRRGVPALTVLFVDHSRVSQAVWNRVLLRLGHRAVVAASAEAALECVDNHAVDVVCTALSLPGMDGIELTRRLRARQDSAALPVIVLTSRDDAATRARCREAGVTDLQPKSDVERLLRRLRSYADQADVSVRGRVLYVEDSDIATHVMTGILRKLNLEVEHFNRADAARAAFAERDYDLVITDIQTSDDFGGTELVAHIRGHAGQRGRIPILATSADAGRARKSELFRLGIDDFLPKPALEEEAVARIGNLVRTKLLRDQVHAQQARLRESALIDPLTGLLNAASLHELGPKYVSEAARHNQPLSLLLIDIDSFNAIIARDGGAMADAAIAAVGRRLREACRGEDLVTRYGDNRFALLLPHCGADHAPVRAEQLRRQVAGLKPEGLTLNVRVGAGSLSRERSADFGELLAAAQQAISARGRSPDAEHEGDAERHQQAVTDIDSPPAHRPAR